MYTLFIDKKYPTIIMFLSLQSTKYEVCDRPSITIGDRSHH
ncbi:hypothetical protein [Dolichospermum compactum]|nr:hypothetical protein [Dolichospermum compactum]